MDSGHPHPKTALKSVYSELMEITDIKRLRQAALSTIRPLVGKSITQRNYKLFQESVISATNIEDLRASITARMMVGTGLTISDSPINAISSLISESSRDVKLTKEQWRLKKLVESYGYHVCKHIMESRSRTHFTTYFLNDEDGLNPLGIPMEIGLDIEYYYEPGEKMVRYYPDGSGYPGSPPYIEFTDFRLTRENDPEIEALSPLQREQILDYARNKIESSNRLTDDVQEQISGEIHGETMDYDY